MTEKYVPEIEGTLPDRPLGNIAITGAHEAAASDLFGTTKSELYRIAPDIDQLTEAMKDYVSAVDGSQDRKPDVVMMQRTPQNTRRVLTSRGNIKMEARLSRKIVLAGAGHANNHDDLEQGLKNVRYIFPEVYEAYDLAGTYDNRIVPAAQALRRLRDVGYEAIDNLREKMDGDEEDKVLNRYTLFKAVARGEVPDDDKLASIEQFNDMSPVVPMAVVASVANEIPRQIIKEARTGAFDSFIALDILRFASNNPESSRADTEKVGQLLTLIDAYNGALDNKLGQDNICNTLAAIIDSWPADRRQIVVEERNKLIERLSSNLLKLFSALSTNGFIGYDVQSSSDLLYESLENYSAESYKRANPQTSDKLALVSARVRAQTANKKRPKTQTKAQKRRKAQAGIERGNRLRKMQELFWSEEHEPEPIKLVYYNSKNENDQFSDSIEPMVDDYIASLSQQGNDKLRQDLQNILDYMRVPDRPIDQPDGVKHIKMPRLTIGEGQYRLFEFKPTDASGLPLHDEYARNTRIYFSQIDSKTRCIVGISQRSGQREFLGSLT